jgi:hypothetical protein
MMFISAALFEENEMRQRNAAFSELSRTFLYTFFSLPGRIDELATL